MHPDASTGSVLPSSELGPLGHDGPADAYAAQQLAIEARQAVIRLDAYYRAERRGFAPGHELEDWFAAERQMSEIEATRERQLQWNQAQSRSRAAGAA